jgi:hypothetical protein
MAAKPYHLKELQSWETREDDILVCTYPKSGKYSKDILFIVSKIK